MATRVAYWKSLDGAHYDTQDEAERADLGFLASAVARQAGYDQPTMAAAIVATLVNAGWTVVPPPAPTDECTIAIDHIAGTYQCHRARREALNEIDAATRGAA